VPLTWRQIKSMRAMQALQPQVKLLQEKYKSDRQILNQKMMEFYKENNVSPFGSCLPLLLQMPVFLGLYYMLRLQGTAVWLPLEKMHVGAFASVWHSSPVGWLWIHDITQFNIVLMFLYIASQFVASWQMSRKGAGQQKIIAYVMPVMIGIFMFVYKWPAGLFIYWFTSNLWTIGQQFAAEKIIPVPVAVVAPPVKEKTTPARPTGKTSARPPAKTSARPAGKSGGKTSGQKTGQQGKATGSKGQRQNRGDGGSKGSS
jgi:YidC/Oxa1 family membrane protein insertase